MQTLREKLRHGSDFLIGTELVCHDSSAPSRYWTQYVLPSIVSNST